MNLKALRQRGAVLRTMIVLHVVAASKHAKPISMLHESKDSVYSDKRFFVNKCLCGGARGQITHHLNALTFIASHTFLPSPPR